MTHQVWSGMPDSRSVNRTWTNKPTSTTARLVCGTCNGGWMGSLEAENSRLLGAMIQGVPQNLTVEEQERITLWCVKTGVMLDRVSAPRVPEEHPRLLFETRRPINHSAIWLAGCNDQTVAMSHVIRSLTPELRLTPGAPNNEALLPGGTDRLEAYIQTIRAGAFVAQIMWSNSKDVVDYVMGWPESGHHARIWPTDNVAVRWPQTIIPTDADFEWFANRLLPPTDHSSTSV